MGTEKQERSGITPESAGAGILAVDADEREARTPDNRSARRTEVPSCAVLSCGQVTAVLDKNYETVKSAIRRGGD